jgi:hypothetical protein
VLEEDLRRAMVDEVASVPPVPDLADAVIHRAGRVRRRRRNAGLLAGLTVLAGAGMALAWRDADAHQAPPAARRPPVSVTHRGAPTPLPPASAPVRTPASAADVPPDVDVLAAGRVSAMDGSSVPLPGPSMARVFEVPLGWIATSVAGGDEPVWLIGRDHAPRELLPSPAPGGLAVSPDGLRIAWQAHTGDPLSVASLTPAGLVARQRVPVGPRVRLAGWYGPFVVLGAGGNGDTRYDLVDVWRPGDPYLPHGTSAAVAVLGLTADRTALLGLARPTGGRGPVCLLRLDPARDLIDQGRRCLPGTDASMQVTLAPDGRHLSARRDATHLVVVDIAAPDARTVATIACAADAHEVWADARTLVVTTGGEILRYRLDGTAAPDVVTSAAPGNPTASPVPRFGG